MDIRSLIYITGFLVYLAVTVTTFIAICGIAAARLKGGR